MNKFLYLICDENNNVAKICGIKMFGVECDIPAIFLKEEQALGVLFEMEEADVLNSIPHVVRKVDRAFTTTQY